jgi:uncharacterized protein
LTDHTVTREVSGTRGRYVIRQNGEEAELTYTVISPTVVSADHTEVPDSFRGTGAGVALVTRMVADARAEGFRINPLCPFAAAQARRHPEWADAFLA